MAISKPLFKRIDITYTPGKYVKEFDGWRGFGILFVVLAHYLPSLFIGSWVFMEMFFVMSGFLITGILIDSKSKEGYYKKFILRRVLRVFPLYYICLIILFFLIPATWLDLSYYRSHQLWFWFYIENWLYALQGWPKVKALHHFWSLAIEEQFYIFWPFVVYVFSTKNLLRFCIFLFFFSIVFRNTGMMMGFVMPFPYVATFARMEGIALGALIAILIRNNKSVLEKLAAPVTIISGFLIVVLFITARSMNFQHFIHYSINYSMVDLFFAGMITLTIAKNELPLLKRIFNSPVMKQLGVMSYCIYIFHYPILVLAEYNLDNYFYRLTGSEGLAKLLYRLVAFAITIPIVLFFHKKIEVPLWRYKKAV